MDREQCMRGGGRKDVLTLLYDRVLLSTYSLLLSSNIISQQCAKLLFYCPLFYATAIAASPSFSALRRKNISEGLMLIREL